MARGFSCCGEFYQLISVLRNAPGRTVSAAGVRRAKAVLSSGCKPHPVIAPAGSNRCSYGGNEVAEAFG